LPTEDIEDRQILKKKKELIEEYKFDEIIKKYNLENYIILIINQNDNEINILSKLQLNNNYKIFNIYYKDIDIYEEQSLSQLIINLKTLYEDEWKKLNLINTSIKLPLTLSLSAKDYDKIKLFEKDKNLLISLLFRRVIYNIASAFLFGWLFIFILLNILSLTTSISSNTMSFISLKNVNSFFYFISLLIIILFSQYSIILKKINKCLRIQIE
jgi:hypothetical protein